MTLCRDAVHDTKTDKAAATMPQPIAGKRNESESKALDNIYVPLHPQGPELCVKLHIKEEATHLRHRFGVIARIMTVATGKPATLTDKTNRRRWGDIRLPTDSQDMFHTEVAPLRAFIGLADTSRCEYWQRICCRSLCRQQQPRYCN